MDLLFISLTTFGIISVIGLFLNVIKRISKYKAFTMASPYMIILAIFHFFGTTKLGPEDITVFVLIPVAIWVYFFYSTFKDDKRKKEYIYHKKRPENFQRNRNIIID